MAIAILNPVIISISGRIGNAVFYVRGNKQCVRSHVIPRNPDTVLQRSKRSIFADAVKSWQSLSESEKDKYRRKAGNFSMSGYNYYISLFIKEYNDRKIKPQNTAPENTKAKYISLPLRFPSVSDSIAYLSLMKMRLIQPKPG